MTQKRIKKSRRINLLTYQKRINLKQQKKNKKMRENIRDKSIPPHLPQIHPVPFLLQANLQQAVIL